jgi:hypothetical protein
MNCISDLLAGDSIDLSSGLFIDPGAWKRLEEPLMRFKHCLTHGTLTRGKLFDYLATIESPEWKSTT